MVCSVQSDWTQALDREALLQEEKAQLKNGLGTALEQKAALEAALQTAQAEQHRLVSEVGLSSNP